jgi:NADPH2:quinone reductase
MRLIPLFNLIFWRYDAEYGSIDLINGGVAEWLGGGLQNLKRRFDSALTPQTYMKAIILTGFGDSSNFQLTSLPDPVASGNEVLIKIKAAAFNPIDYQMRKGLRESKLMRSPVLGREFSGVVIEAGPHANRFKPGDEVMGLAGSMGSNGTYAEYISLNEQLLAKKPPNISFEQAAAIPSSGLTAWECFSRAGIRPEESIFITGATGGVGRFFIKLLKLYGVHRIVATAGNNESAKTLNKLGIANNDIIDYKVDNIEGAILSANGGHRFDYSADLVGGAISEVAARVLKINGSYLDVTFLGTPKTRDALFDSACKIYNIAAYAYGANGNFSWYGATLSLLADLIEINDITAPDINIIGDLSEETVQKAHHLMETNYLFGKKIVMTI